MLPQLDFDYFTLSYHFPSLQILKQSYDTLLFECDDEIDYTFTRPMKMPEFHDFSAKSYRGCTIGYTILPDNSVDSIIQIPGEPLSSRNDRFLYSLFYIHKYNVGCSRLDIRMDYLKSYLHSLRLKMKQFRENKLHSGFRTIGYISSLKTVKSNDILRETFNFGGRSSATFIRIYDKEIDINLCRFEAELKKHRSLYAYQYLIDSINTNNSEHSIISSLFSYSVQSIDFYEEKKDINLDRNIQATFWTEFLDLISFIELPVNYPKIPKSIQRTLRFLSHSVQPSLALVRHFFGSHFPEYLREFLNDGDRRLSNLQRMMLENIACA